jgi:hypothetical protein
MAVHTLAEVLEKLQLCLRLGSQPPAFLSQRGGSGCSGHSSLIMESSVYVACRTDVAGP